MTYTESGLANRVGDQFEQNNFCSKQSFVQATIRKSDTNQYAIPKRWRLAPFKGQLCITNFE